MVFWRSVAAELVDPGMVRALRGLVWRPREAAGVNVARRSECVGVPVVLVHGALSGVGATWSTFGPLWSGLGLNVFAASFGAGRLSCGGRFGGLDGVWESVSQLGRFVDLVCDWSGSEVVDVVGHSVGALVGLGFVNAGGASRVRRWVGVAPCLRGTVSRGLLSSTVVRRAVHDRLAGSSLSGLADVTFESAMVGDFWRRFPTPAGGVDYVAIRSRFDRSVTPLSSQVLPGLADGVSGVVRNVLLQDVCPQSVSNHRTMTTDGCVGELVYRALTVEDVASEFPGDLGVEGCRQGL